MLKIEQASTLEGVCQVPGDKSISHRAVMLAAISEGTTRITGFLKGEDCLATIGCLRQMGVEIREEKDEIVVEGVGLKGLKEPTTVLDAGNSGTTMRLLSGILAGQPFMSVLTGDESLHRRPMARVTDPLKQMGAFIDGREEGRKAPLVIRGGNLKAIQYDMPVSSAQVKSAVLLAGLYAEGETCVEEIQPSRDHTERMLTAFGGHVEVRGLSRRIKPSVLKGCQVEVPGDISSAAFVLVAAACVKGSKVKVESVGVNPTRSGILDVLEQMGAVMTVENQREVGGESIADLTIEGSDLKGVEIGAELIPSLIDEIPVIAVAAACAHGETRITGAQELRVKETDRISAMAQELEKIGVQVETLEDGMVIQGPQKIAGGRTESHGDHRIAMAMAVAGLMAEQPVTVENPECIAVSFPGFEAVITQLVVRE